VSGAGAALSRQAAALASQGLLMQASTSSQVFAKPLQTSLCWHVRDVSPAAESSQPVLQEA
jgi:hypothetical protein